VRLATIVACALLCSGIPSAFADHYSSPDSVWEFNSPVDAPFCQIDGKSSEGSVSLFAGPHVSKPHPDSPMVENVYTSPYVALTLSKPTWDIPVNTRITALMSFSDGTSLTMTGTGTEHSVSFEFKEATLKPWIHGFTSAKTGSIAFAGGDEPVWNLELHGTTPAVTAMYHCVQGNELQVPAPLGTPTKATQPFSR
jgi:hypothetical protein